MTQIEPFHPESVRTQANVAHILVSKPVKNLTEEEVLTTLRLLQLHAQLIDEYGCVCIHRNDHRLAGLDDKDRFLAMLIDCDQRDVLLATRKCRGLFDGSAYHWRKIAKKCAITDTASAVSECSSGYYGRGWVIAPHIRTLIRWIVVNADNERISKLKAFY